MPNSKRLTPEASEEERDSPRNPPTNNEPEESSPPVAAAGRRDENSISFRHFLQSDAGTSRHRPPRGAHSGAVDLVDVTMALPDFVQDHLVVESLNAGGDHQIPTNHSNHSSSPLDLSVLNEILPDYSASQRNAMTNGHRRRNFEDSGGLNSNNGDVSLAQGQTAALPDFLSDGPMHCSNNENLTASPSSSRGISCRSSNLVTDNRIDDSHRSSSFDGDNSQHQQIERLRREAAEKTRRVNQLEAEFARHREETESQLRSAEQRAAEANIRAADAERQLALLTRENTQLKDQLNESSSQSLRGDSNVPPDSNSLAGTSSTVTNGPVTPNGNRSLNANEVLNFTRTSENLLSQLMNCIVDLKTAAVSSLEEGMEPEPKRKKDSSENL